MTAKSNPTRRLFRLKLAAEYLSVSPGLLRSIIQRGDLPIIRLGENGHVPWLIDVRDLDAWVEKSKVVLEL
jgi:excisionase family DNA binding protein